MKILVLIICVLTFVGTTFSQRVKLDTVPTGDKEYPKKVEVQVRGKLHAEMSIDSIGKSGKLWIYYPSGKIKNIYDNFSFIRKDTCVDRWFYKNGQVKSETVFAPNGRRKYSKSFRRNGKLKSLSDGEGLARLPSKWE
jgi:antitoxin component YwqK of YwqJK toxin-antitoxin module